jgi:hypothetical protein
MSEVSIEFKTSLRAYIVLILTLNNILFFTTQIHDMEPDLLLHITPQK